MYQSSDFGTRMFSSVMMFSNVIYYQVDDFKKSSIFKCEF